MIGAEIFEHTLLHLIWVYAIFYSTFSNNLAILLAISDTTAYQTGPSNQGCMISYSAVTVSNKHEIKYGDDSILNIEQKFSSIHCVSRPRGYKTFFVLNSVEHEILNAHKYKYIKKFGLFKAQLSLECYFSHSYMLKCQQLLAF